MSNPDTTLSLLCAKTEPEVKSLTTKQTKIASFIHYYNSILIDNGISDKNTLDSFSHLWSNNISQQADFINQYLDYETSHNLEYKNLSKKSLLNHKLQNKNITNYNKLKKTFLDKYIKIFHKTLKADPLLTQLLLLHEPTLALNALPNELRSNPSRNLPKLQPTLSQPLALHSHNLPPQHPINLLLLPKLPTPPTNPNPTTPHPPSALITENNNKTETHLYKKKGIQPSNYTKLIENVIDCLDD